MRGALAAHPLLLSSDILHFSHLNHISFLDSNFFLSAASKQNSISLKSPRNNLLRKDLQSGLQALKGLKSASPFVDWEIACVSDSLVFGLGDFPPRTDVLTIICTQKLAIHLAREESDLRVGESPRRPRVSQPSWVIGVTNARSALVVAKLWRIIAVPKDTIMLSNANNVIASSSTQLLRRSISMLFIFSGALLVLAAFRSIPRLPWTSTIVIITNSPAPIATRYLERQLEWTRITKRSITLIATIVKSGTTLITAAALQAHQGSAAHYYQCPRCELKFRTVEARGKHKATTHFSCDKCTLDFSSKANLNHHKNTQHEFPCDSCDKIFDSAFGRQAHAAAVHFLKCSHCEATFMTGDARTDHINKDHRIWCKECPLKFRSAAELSAHHSAKHARQCEICSGAFPDNDKSSTRHEYFCLKCKKCFSTSKERDSHKASIHAFTCGECKEDFKTTNLLDEHKAASHGFTCIKCTVLFESAVSLKTHEKTVHQIACPKCAEACESPLKLLWHYGLIHMHRCETCGAAFEDEESLKDHTASAHTEETAFICGSCEDCKFLSQAALAKHTADFHTSQLKWPCWLCNNVVFSTGEMFMEHMLAIHRDKMLSKSSEWVKDPTDIVNEAAKPIIDNSKHEECSSEASVYHDMPSPVNHTSAINQSNPQGQQLTYTCQYCSDTLFFTEAALNKHDALFHGDTSAITGIIHPDLPAVDYTPSPPYKMPIVPEPKKIHACEPCGEIFTNAETLRRHISNFHPETLERSCSICPDMIFRTFDRLREHHVEKHGYLCPFCLEAFKEEKLLSTHIDDHHMYSCHDDDCAGLSFWSLEAVEKHIERDHYKSLTDDDDKYLGIVDSVLRCATCTTHHQQHCEVEQLKDVEPKEDKANGKGDDVFPFSDSKLPQASSSPSSQECTACTTYHKHHGIIYICKDCPGAEYTTQADLDRHIDQSPFHGKPKFDCTECFIQFKDQIQLLTHIESKPHKTKWVLSML
ncbi:hypothetical protein VTL71DRAFT_2098 [Oculimacula yallundae]|uniref:C2H2-type domain-containing protein n=1 Tax=Oculimacula yallundae TaxID=86028 RepID=A0ABR4C8M8_9HELO